MRPTIRRTPRRHWKLKTATIAAFVVAAFLAIVQNWVLAGVAILIGAATLAVQWISISPPGVDEPYLDHTRE